MKTIDYDKKTKLKHGVYFTPLPMVNFSINMTDDLLKYFFNKKLDSEGIKIIEPFMGVGGFITELLKTLPKDKLKYKYENDIHGRELLNESCGIAKENIEKTYNELTNEYIQFNNIKNVDSFVDFDYNIGDIPIIISNPPYGKGTTIDEHHVINSDLKETYVKNSKSTLKKALYDPYVKAIKLAEKTIGKNGIITYVTNNSFLKSTCFDGMRACLNKEFNYIYVLNLGGNGREKTGKKIYNVFDVLVGIAIVFLVKKENVNEHRIFYKNLPDDVPKEDTFEKLNKFNLDNIDWVEINPIVNNWKNKKGEDCISQQWFSSDVAEFSNSISLGNKEVKNNLDTKTITIFKSYSPGAITGKDKFYIDSDKNVLIDRIKTTIEEKGNKTFNKNKITKCLYKQMIKKYVYFDKIYGNSFRPSKQDTYFPIGKNKKNRVICLTTPSGRKYEFVIFMSNLITMENTIPGGLRSYPFFIYDKEGKERIENVRDEALKLFKDHYKDQSITKLDIFYYVFGVLSNKNFKKKYLSDLLYDHPKVPLFKNFKKYLKYGKKLSKKLIKKLDSI